LPLRSRNELRFSAQPMIQVFAVGTAFALPDRIGSVPESLLSIASGIVTPYQYLPAPLAMQARSCHSKY
jgi:hypothetical protein